MHYYLIHLIVSAVIRGLIYLAIWKAGQFMSLSQVIVLLLIVLLVVIVVGLAWRFIARWRYRP